MSIVYTLHSTCTYNHGFKINSKLKIDMSFLRLSLQYSRRRILYNIFLPIIQNMNTTKAVEQSQSGIDLENIVKTSEIVAKDHIKCPGRFNNLCRI